MKKLIGALTVLLAVLAVLISACSSAPFEKAFKPEMEADESNKILTEYCQGCHLHKDFDPGKHVPKVQKAYNNPKFSSASECRECHSYEKTFLMDVRRTTHWPAKK